MQNIHPIIEEALRNFFDRSDLNEFSAQLIKQSQHSNLKPKIEDAKLKEQIDFELNDGLKIRSQIDLLITFAEKKLSNEKFIDLLLLLGQLTITSGEFTPSIEIHEKIISLTQHSPQMINIAANASLALGEIYSRQAQWELSFNYLEKAVKFFEQENNLKGNANCENLFGTIYGDMGNLEKAKNHFENALAVLEDNPDNAMIGKIEVNLGIINNIIGNYDEALSYLKRALIIFEKIGKPKRIAEIRQNLGMVYTKKKDYNSAVKEFDLSLKTSMDANYIQTLGIAYISKAFVYTKINDLILAEAFAEKAMELFYRINDKLSMAEVYKIKGIIKRNQKLFDESENFLLTSLRLNKELGNKLNSAETSSELGLLYIAINEKEKSTKYFNEALGYFKEIKAEEEIKEIENLLSRI